MIFDVSGTKFQDIFGDEKFQLPIRWDGLNFKYAVGRLFDSYISQVHKMCPKANLRQLNEVCQNLTAAIQTYLDGFPAEAYRCLCKVMEILVRTPLKLSYSGETQRMKHQLVGNCAVEVPPLFRVTTVPDNKPYPRERIFHTPYDMRSKVSSSRYSIAGFPSLYLGTSLELCCEEIHLNPYQSYGLAGVFRPTGPLRQMEPEMEIWELSIKPQDFLETQVWENDTPYGRERRRGSHDGELWLKDEAVRGAYLMWYPLVAACSYIRVNKADPFAAEYIIPQLLMQWVRDQMRESHQRGENAVVGIRYFSCASVRASRMGVNYVFPTSGVWKWEKKPYCPVLAKTFRVSKPVYIHEFDSIAQCEEKLKWAGDLKRIKI